MMASQKVIHDYLATKNSLRSLRAERTQRTKGHNAWRQQAAKDELHELVRKTIEETVNAMLDEEADQLVGAGPYERTDEHAAYRAGHYERGYTTSGEVVLGTSKLRGAAFQTAVIVRYRRRKTRIDEAIIEMCLVGCIR